MHYVVDDDDDNDEGPQLHVLHGSSMSVGPLHMYLPPAYHIKR